MKHPTHISPHADVVLSQEIWPSRLKATTDTVFLTGATGFLGAQVLAELLRATDWNVVCLVRADDNSAAMQRIAEAIVVTGRDCGNFASRVIPLRGDLAKPDFGLSTADFDALATSVGQVIHCAAEVSWIKPYRRLRGSHITGILNIIRLACRCTVKPLHFVSTLAICYVPDGPDAVDEETNMAAYLEHIPLGYAQAKCVAESLLRQAAERSLPVSILRCGVICGDSVSGISNHEDIISRMLRGSVSSGIAPDVDWALDCVPVDTVAQALCVLAQDRPTGFRLFHLHHDAPRQWREMVLWLRLNGYDVSLVPLDEWLEMVGDERSNRAPDLHVLKPFFLARPPLMGGRSMTELYLEPKRRCIQSDASRSYFDTLGLEIPRLDAHLLNRYLLRYQQQGFLPERQSVLQTKPDLTPHSAVAMGLRSALGAPALEIAEFRSVPLSGSGVLSELSSVSSGGRTGLWRCHAHYQREPEHSVERMEAVLKLRSTDSEQDAATVAVAELCSQRLGVAFRDQLHNMAYHSGLSREIAIATSGDSRLSSYMPRSLAAHPHDSGTRGYLIEEHLDEVDLIDSANGIEDWRSEHVEAAVNALGQIHSVWYRCEDELMQQPWLAPGANCVSAMLPLWRELADFSAERFSLILGEDSKPLQHRLIDELGEWWPQWTSMPRTLIHNDFNPRNMGFRRSPQGPVLCAYDWELATIGLPQYDLAELLCFVLPVASTPQDAQPWIELHRSCLADATGQFISAKEWQTGFALALRHYMVSRLPLYMMIDRFKPQPFLSRVVTNWLRLHLWAEQKVPHRAARLRAVET